MIGIKKQTKQTCRHSMKLLNVNTTIDPSVIDMPSNALNTPRIDVSLNKIISI